MSVYDQTDVYGFNLIDFNTVGYQELEYQNWRKLEGIITSIGTPDKFAVDVGGTNAFVLNFVPGLSIYSTGMIITFRALNANTGPATVNINGLGPKNILWHGAPLVGGEIPANSFVKLVYDGTSFHQIEPKVPPSLLIPDGSLTPDKLTAGAPVWDGSGNLTGAGDIDYQGVVNGDGGVTAAGKHVFRHAGAQTSGTVTFSTSDPSGGADGDIWIKYTP